MTHTSAPLKQIDHFSLVSFFRQQGVSPFLRFLKPTNECMSCFEAVKIGGKIVAAAGAFPLVLKANDVTARIVFIGSFASMSASDEFVEPLAGNLQKRLAVAEADAVLCDSPALSSKLGVSGRTVENVYTLTRKSMDMADAEIKKVFAFVDLNVIMDKDFEQLKKVYSNGIHYEIPEDNFRLALGSNGNKPVVVKDSRGNVTGLLLTDDCGSVKALYAMTPDELPHILRAYMILFGKDELQIRTVAENRSVCGTLEAVCEKCHSEEGLFFSAKPLLADKPEMLFPMPL